MSDQHPDALRYALRREQLDGRTTEERPAPVWRPDGPADTE
jgi:hypothetical protein